MATPILPPITPGQRIGELIKRLGDLQSALGSVLRYGPKAPDPERMSEQGSAQPNIVFVVDALLRTKEAIAAVEKDIGDITISRKQDG